MALTQTHYQPLRPEDRRDDRDDRTRRADPARDETIVASGDRHDLDIETLCIGEAA